MSETFHLKQDDTMPRLEATLSDHEDNPIDLTGADVQLRLQEPRGGGVALEGYATVADDDAGLVHYEWTDSDTAETGRYRLDFVVEYSTDDKETIPSDGYHDLVITA